jgi:hypothetical protein
MATQVPPKKGTEYTFEHALVSQATTERFQTSITIAASTGTADVRVSKDGGAFANITTNPTEIGTSGVISVTLSADEMDADRIAVLFSDQADDEWCDSLVIIHTVTSHQMDDLLADITADLNKIADHVIRRTFQNACDSSDGDSKTGRSLLGAIAKLVNKIEASGGTLTVYEDDDSTSLYTQSITTSADADPITVLDTT